MYMYIYILKLSSTFLSSLNSLLLLKMSQVNLAGHQVGHVGFGLMRMSIYTLLQWLTYRIDLDPRAG